MTFKYSADRSYSLRVSEVDRSVLDEFSITFPDVQFDYRELKGRKDLYVLVFPLLGDTDFSSLNDFLADMKANENRRIDIFMSVSSEMDNCIVDLPAHIIHAVKVLPITDFSVSFIFMDE